MTTETIIDPSRYAWSYSSLQDDCAGTAKPSTTRFVANYNGQRVKSSKYPDWKQRIARGENCTNNYSRSGYIFKHAGSNISWTSSKQCGLQDKALTGYRMGTANNSPPSSLTLPTDYGTALAKATGQFAAEVLAAQQHLSGMVFAAELGKALKMIRSPARGIENLLHSYLNNCASLKRKYRRKVSKGILEADIYDLWLQQAFGWAPLIGDTMKGAEAISRLLHGDRPTRQVRGYASEKTHQITGTSVYSVAGGLMRGTSEFRDKTEVSCSIRGAVRAKGVGPTWRGLELFGFQADQFIPSLWELCPMSWVTDYFSNVGDILSATYTDFSGLYWDSVTRKVEATRQYVETAPRVIPTAGRNFTGSGAGGSWTLTRKTFNRTRLENRVPELVFSFPGNPNQVVNLSAVILKSKGISASLAGVLK